MEFDMPLSVFISEKRFGNKVIFKDFSYTFSEVGAFALIGESGIGKTTLLRMIAGLDTKYKGRIEGGGAKNVSFVFQEYRLFPELSALDNILCTCREITPAARSEAFKSLIELGFSHEDTALLPAELSGGMKQRVSIARALTKKAPVLLLDEPTKELDAELKRKLDEIIIEEAKRRTVILVSHDTAEIDFIKATKIFMHRY